MQPGSNDRGNVTGRTAKRTQGSQKPTANPRTTEGPTGAVPQTAAKPKKTPPAK
jgi:hypothetical protein